MTKVSPFCTPLAHTYNLRLAGCRAKKAKTIFASLATSPNNQELKCLTDAGAMPEWFPGIHVTVSPSPQSKDEENEKLHELRRYARDFRRQHTTDAERFNWDSDDEDYGLAIGRLVIT
jgi:hypothetical protein